MRLLFAAAVLSATLTAALALPAVAADTAQQTGMKSCAATWKTMSAADKAKTKYTDYMGTCMKGGAKTAAAPPPAMAMSGKPMMSGSMNSMKMEAGGQANPIAAPTAHAVMSLLKMI